MKTWTLDEVAEHWNSTLDYDEINDKTASYERRFTDSAKMYDLKPGSRVLDIDARTGRGSEFWYNRSDNCEFTCLVVSDLFKNIATERLAEAKVPAVVKKFDSMPLPLESNTFDTAFSYETLEHVPWPTKYIAELVRVTKPGGDIILTTPNVSWEPIHLLAPILKLHHSEGPHRMVPRAKIMAAFKEAGCEMVKERTTVLVPAGPKWLLELGETLEKMMGEKVRTWIALRRIFIYRKK